MTPEELEGMNGRRALIEGVIVSGEPDGSSAVLVRFGPDVDSDDGCAFVPYDAIREILPEPIKVGSVVKEGEVLAIHGSSAWIKEPDGLCFTYPLSSLTLVEQGQ